MERDDELFELVERHRSLKRGAHPIQDYARDGVRGAVIDWETCAYQAECGPVFVPADYVSVPDGCQESGCHTVEDSSGLFCPLVMMAGLEQDKQKGFLGPFRPFALD